VGGAGTVVAAPWRTSLSRMASTSVARRSHGACRQMPCRGPERRGHGRRPSASGAGSCRRGAECAGTRHGDGEWGGVERPDRADDAWVEGGAHDVGGPRLAEARVEPSRKEQVRELAVRVRTVAEELGARAAQVRGVDASAEVRGGGERDDAALEGLFQHGGEQKLHKAEVAEVVHTHLPLEALLGVFACDAADACVQDEEVEARLLRGERRGAALD